MPDANYAENETEQKPLVSDHHLATRQAMKEPVPGVARALRIFGVLSIIAGVFMSLLGLGAALLVGGGIVAGGIQAVVGGCLLIGAGKGIEILWEMRCAARASLEIQLTLAEKD